MGIESDKDLESFGSDTSLISARSILKNPVQADKKLMLEARIAEQYVDEFFVINGVLDSSVNARDSQIEFYMQQKDESIFVGTAELDRNNTFTFVNTTTLAPGVYDLVASTKSELGENIYSEPIFISINPKMKTIPLNVKSLGSNQLIQESNSKSKLENPFEKQIDSSVLISGLKIEPGQPVTLDLEVPGELSQVIVNFNSVLYSSTAIASSTNSQMQFEAPLELGFEAGTTHTATAYAESLEDPTRKSKAVIIEFTIEDPTPWYFEIYFLLAVFVCIAGSGAFIYHSGAKSA